LQSRRSGNGTTAAYNGCGKRTLMVLLQLPHTATSKNACCKHYIHLLRCCCCSSLLQFAASLLLLLLLIPLTVHVQGRQAAVARVPVQPPIQLQLL
jgi:hypothetical protein